MGWDGMMGLLDYGIMEWEGEATERPLTLPNSI
jgi:hypothetical protein